MWWLRRSIRTISASACRSACAAAIPAKPPPTITTRLRSRRGASMTAVASVGRVSANIAFMDHLVCAFCHEWLQQLAFGLLSMCNHSDLLEPRGTSTVLKEPGVRDQDHLVGKSLIRAQRRLLCFLSFISQLAFSAAFNPPASVIRCFDLWDDPTRLT